jgi:cytochrome c-type biogenesis protein
MGWSESLGQVMQTRPVLAYGASYLGGVAATDSPCILGSISLVIGFVGGYAGGNK